MAEITDEQVLDYMRYIRNRIEGSFRESNELNDYGKLNQVVFLGELFIASEKRYEKAISAFDRVIQILEEKSND